MDQRLGALMQSQFNNVVAPGVLILIPAVKPTKHGRTREAPLPGAASWAACDARKPAASPLPLHPCRDTPPQLDMPLLWSTNRRGRRTAVLTFP